MVTMTSTLWAAQATVAGTAITVTVEADDIAEATTRAVEILRRDHGEPTRLRVLPEDDVAGEVVVVEPVALADIAEEIGLARRSLDPYRDRPGFPQGVETALGTIYSRAEVEAFIAAHDIGLKKYAAFGEEKTLSAWVADPRCQVNLNTLKSRLRRGQTLEQAMTTFPRKRSS